MVSMRPPSERRRFYRVHIRRARGHKSSEIANRVHDDPGHALPLGSSSRVFLQDTCMRPDGDRAIGGDCHFFHSTKGCSALIKQHPFLRLYRYSIELRARRRAILDDGLLDPARGDMMISRVVHVYRGRRGGHSTRGARFTDCRARLGGFGHAMARYEGSTRGSASGRGRQRGSERIQLDGVRRRRGSLHLQTQKAARAVGASALLRIGDRLGQLAVIGFF